MKNDGSLKTATKQFVFDLDSQKEVTILLASLRSAQISADQKNELRDLIFLYSNGGKDESVRLTIEQKVTAYGIVPIVSMQSTSTPEPVAPAKPKLPFGTSRPAPSFTSSFKAPAIEPADNKPVPVAEPTPQPVVVPIIEPELVKEPTPNPVEESLLEPAAAAEQEAIEIHKPMVAEVKPEPVFASAPVIITEPNSGLSPKPLPSQLVPDSARTLERIREIKSLVNDKVGNPVNLVDIDNEVGREYMSALLDAMKKINSGTSALSAMKRLELSFIEVQKTLKNYVNEKSQVQIESNTVEEPTPQPLVTINHELSNKPEPLSEVKSVAEPASNPNPVFTPAPHTEHQLADKPEISFLPEINPEPNFLVQEEAQILKDVAELPMTFTSKFQKTELVPNQKLDDSLENHRESALKNIDSKTEIKQESRIPISRITSLADIKKQPSIDYLKFSSDLETSSVSGNPLFTKQIDIGLNSLLKEWSIFKKSGLFGTGPNGVEHPLFKKISGLQIPLLLAGRFEEATQEVKQSITDYMNGWRYEQGIIYEQGETFEHYLRRVIRHILDLQKNK